MIEVQGICKSYGSHRALENLSFSMEQGGVVGFLGVNGAGKSTCMRILTTYLAPDSGMARVCGFDIEKNPREVRRSIGYLPESNPSYPELRVNEFLNYRARLKGLCGKNARKAVEYAAGRCGIEGVFRRVIGQLSKGYRQRVGLAESMLGDSKLLILDEPMVGLDPNQVRDIRALIEELGSDKTVFLSTHIMRDVELLCRRAIIIHGGRLLADGSPAELCSKSHKPRQLELEVVTEDGMTEALKKLNGVRAVTNLGRLGGGVEKLGLTCAAGKDLRAEVLSLFGQRNWILNGMNLTPVHLEDIFAEITTSAPGRGEGALASAESAAEGDK